MNGMKPEFDEAAAHRYFSAHCFNRAWKLIGKTDRSPDEDRLMVALSQASLYHWLQRDDCDDRRLSIGYWQASRVQALIGNADEARKYAEVALSHSAELAPFYRGFAHEALARAESVAGNREKAAAHAEKARALAMEVEEAEERDLLLGDLATL